jgi:hypothetical protein
MVFIVIKYFFTLKILVLVSGRPAGFYHGPQANTKKYLGHDIDPKLNTKIKQKNQLGIRPKNTKN